MEKRCECGAVTMDPKAICVEDGKANVCHRPAGSYEHCGPLKIHGLRWRGSLLTLREDEPHECRHNARLSIVTNAPGTLRIDQHHCHMAAWCPECGAIGYQSVEFRGELLLDGPKGTAE